MGIPPSIQLANLGMADSIILMVMALVVFGPRRLPQIGRQIGKLMYEFRKASNDFKFQMEEELRLAEEADRRKKEEAERARVAALAAQVPAFPATPVQTIEAQADIGAVESPAASTDASPYPDSPYPDSPYPGEDRYPVTPGVDPPPVTTPRVQPPSSGEQVNAAHPGPIEPVEAASVSLSDTPYSEPAAESSPNIESPNSPSEPVSQHG
jgi:sec-independent protein translocase protein TatB